MSIKWSSRDRIAEIIEGAPSGPTQVHAFGGTGPECCGDLGVSGVDGGRVVACVHCGATILGGVMKMSSQQWSSRDRIAEERQKLNEMCVRLYGGPGERR